MKLHLLSIKVRGINNDQKVGMIRDYLNNLSPKVDVLCLREHNIRMMWRRDTFWALEASPSIEVEDRRIGDMRGGIAICFHPRHQPLIYDQGSLENTLEKNKVQWITSKGLEGGHIGILNVYASNTVGERCAMWNDVFQFLLMDCKWIMTSDFNMVDNSLD